MMDQGPISSRGVEGWDSCSSCPNPFSKGSLKKKETEQWNSGIPIFRTSKANKIGSKQQKVREIRGKITVLDWGKVTTFQSSDREVRKKWGFKNSGFHCTIILILSSSVTWGVSSTSSSPDRYCRSNSAFSPTYDEIIRFICRITLKYQTMIITYSTVSNVTVSNRILRKLTWLYCF